ncbi:MAG: helix-turn-helix transcriptional regulator, partial [Candidatus ainarchaeum sp.]|nr:helix-turn-helix transcriptional regulator [Candidatus ainarchaeum sp.]
MDKQINSFGSLLAEHRKELGMTGEQMAKRLRISHSYYNAFETGKRHAPEQDMVDQMADVPCL